MLTIVAPTNDELAENAYRGQQAEQSFTEMLERDHYKEQITTLRNLLLESDAYLAHFPCTSREQREHLAGLEAKIKTALAETAGPEDDTDIPF